MKKIVQALSDINAAICENIDQADVLDRGLLSVNVIAQLRNLVEHVCLLVCYGENAEVTYDNIKKAKKQIRGRGDLRFLSKFHKYLQVSMSHYTPDKESSERLMLKYYEYLLQIKRYLREVHNLTMLENIGKFPLDTDPRLKEYYEKISKEVDLMSSAGVGQLHRTRYYVQKVKPFFVRENVYYEVTFVPVSENASKFDRTIAFTNLDISQNYAVQLSLASRSIRIMGRVMPILVIDDWNMAIRPCELNNFSNILGYNYQIRTESIEYRELMLFLKETRMSLTEYVESPEEYYDQVKEAVTRYTKTVQIFEVLDRCRQMLATESAGCNVIRYLLHCMNNRIIKLQRSNEACDLLSGLHLKFQCIPFDTMPFCTSLWGHNPKIADLFECLDPSGREHELFARFLKNNAETQGRLYTPVDEIEGFGDIDSLIAAYNSQIYRGHPHRKIDIFNRHVYVREYEEDTHFIIEKLLDLTRDGVSNHAQAMEDWLKQNPSIANDEEKACALKNMFSRSHVALVYGAAGTGKTTMIQDISKYFAEKQKLYLAITNPAVDNLRRRVSDVPQCEFKTVAKLKTSDKRARCDVLFIDECSTVSNSDMRTILNKVSFEFLVLVGDVHQIESIVFGNWFDIARSFVPKSSWLELTTPHRSKDPNLRELWSKVRSLDDGILEHIARSEYSARLDETLFKQFDEDEIVLCLNYDGLYGINNINSFLQNANENPAVEWGVHRYKVADPILFNESERFAPVLYNNLKGRIERIDKCDDRIRFEIELESEISETDAQGMDFSLIERKGAQGSVIAFDVKAARRDDEDQGTLALNTVVPFQVAYAVSIHKAQGLEYNSVKVIITREVEELITHNIFYTAITRAREKLKIYWSPETERTVLQGFEIKRSEQDAALLASKYGLKRVRSRGTH